MSAPTSNLADVYSGHHVRARAARAPVDDSPTVPDIPDGCAATMASASSLADVNALVGGDLRTEDRYHDREQLGEGGMGEVRLCRDRNIGRDVAMKVVRQEHAKRNDLKVRFVREARVQGQLEHPAIVPVYDIGTDSSGALFFTMKRVRGTTLEDIFELRRDGAADVRAAHTLRKLLAAFGQVCLAVDFAHARGVLHRDLKPSNVMLGDFGEVYVLDWGIAKIVTGGHEEEEAVVDSSPVVGSGTECGAVLGTPGYMAPEQRRGDVARLDARTDVYALGVILRDILDLEVDSPPELDAICRRATAADPEVRFPSARALHQALERFLEGDRDVEMRRNLAAEHARTAAQHAQLALSSDGPAADAERRRALQQVGRALALDASNAVAMRTLIDVMTTPPREMPASAQQEMLADARVAQAGRYRQATISGMVWCAAAMFALVSGTCRNTVAMAAFVALWATSTGLCLLLARRPHHEAKTHYVVFGIHTLTVTATSGLFGPFLLVPALATVVVIALMNNPDRSRRWAVLSVGCVGLLLPLLLEWLGVLPPSYSLHDGVLTILPRWIELSPRGTIPALLVGNLVILLCAAAVMAKFRDGLTAAERRLYVQAWQLRQLLPG
jgi:serine/threonine protein kinase